MFKIIINVFNLILQDIIENTKVIKDSIINQISNLIVHISNQEQDIIYLILNHIMILIPNKFHIYQLLSINNNRNLFKLFGQTKIIFM